MPDQVLNQAQLLNGMIVGATGATLVQTLRNFVLSTTAGASGGGVGPALTVGATGATGASSTGATGATGAASTVPGATGSTGATGAASTIPGATGATGAASTVPGATGSTGATGAASSVPGATGATGAASTIPGATGATGPLPTLGANSAVITDSGGVLAASVVTSSELGYVSGVTSLIQTQLDAKFPKFVLTANKAVVLNSGGTDIVASATTDTELGYSSGVTSPIQTQLDAKLAKAANLSDLASAPAAAANLAGTAIAADGTYPFPTSVTIKNGLVTAIS